MHNGDLMSITIKDIAKQLNISPSTVSRALSDHPDINTRTKKKVNAMAAKLHYHPNSMARNLKKSSSNIIGVIVPQVKHYFFAAIMAGITDVAYDAGFSAGSQTDGITFIQPIRDGINPFDQDSEENFLPPYIPGDSVFGPA